MNKILLGMAAAVAMLFSATASATLILKVEDSTAGSSVTVQDNLAGDVGADVGEIVYVTDTANFDLTVVTGTGSEKLSLPNVMDLGIIGSFTADTTVSVFLTETGLTGFDAAGIIASLAATSDTSGISYTLFGGNSNVAFDLTNTIVTAGASETTGLIDFSSVLYGGEFSLTLVATLDGKAGSFYSTDTLVVPEPSMIALMSLGLVGLGFAGRRKLSK